MAERKNGWTHVRVRLSTRERLRAHCRAATAAHQAGLTSREVSDQPVTGGEQGGLTIDQAIRDLLDRDDAHRERSRRQRARRRARRVEDAGPAEGPPAAPPAAGGPLVSAYDLLLLAGLRDEAEAEARLEHARREKGGAL